MALRFGHVSSEDGLEMGQQGMHQPERLRGEREVLERDRFEPGTLGAHRAGHEHLRAAARAAQDA
jgi:hypothetical protein